MIFVSFLPLCKHGNHVGDARGQSSPTAVWSVQEQDLFCCVLAIHNCFPPSYNVMLSNEWTWNLILEVMIEVLEGTQCYFRGVSDFLV